MRKLIKRRGFKYLFSFIVMTLIIISMAIQPMITNLLGEEILIKTKAYDPRDIFRGDYIRLNYEINEIDISKLDEEILDRIDEDNNYIDIGNESVYVLLSKRDNYYEVDRVTLTKPQDGIYIEGRYSYPRWRDNGIKEAEIDRNIDGIRVDYALDKYYVPENTGKELEEKVQNGEAFAKLKVYKGYVLLKDIVLE